jgi:peptide/nickel transport system ATP-binding protein
VSLLEVDNLTIDYGDAPEPAVDRLSFNVRRGESLGLVGESGSGKTQCALGIMGLLPPHAKVRGKVLLCGVDLIGQPPRVLNRFRARRLAMVFQDPKQALNPYLRIGEQLKRVLLEHRIARRGCDARNQAQELLRRVGLPDVERQCRSYPHQLSGGMRQRAMIALALAVGPELLIADEPTTALDVTVQAQILCLLQELRRQSGIAILLITHDLGVIAENCERMLVMHRGRLLEQGATSEVFLNPMHPETRAMLAAAPRIDASPAGLSAPSEEAPLLRVKDLSVNFNESSGKWRRQRPLPVVRRVSLSLRRGETLALVGESGSGKTTLARAILGLVPTAAGTITIPGARRAGDLRSRSRNERHELQLVFQDPLASLNPAMTVEAIISEAVVLREPRLARPGRRARCIAALARVGLDERLLHRFPHELSGGQAQRVAIARCLTLGPKILICDEAVAALDGTVRTEVLELLKAEQGGSGLSLLFITHDLAVVRQISHRILVMYMGRLCEVASNEALFERPRHPYTRALLDSVPVADPAARGWRTAGIAREISSPDKPPSGCPFHPRCAFAVQKCSEVLPDRQRIDGSDVACHRARDLDLRSATMGSNRL